MPEITVMLNVGGNDQELVIDTLNWQRTSDAVHMSLEFLLKENPKVYVQGETGEYKIGEVLIKWEVIKVVGSWFTQNWTFTPVISGLPKITIFFQSSILKADENGHTYIDDKTGELAIQWFYGVKVDKGETHLSVSEQDVFEYLLNGKKLASSYYD